MTRLLLAGVEKPSASGAVAGTWPQSTAQVHASSESDAAVGRLHIKGLYHVYLLQVFTMDSTVARFGLIGGRSVYRFVKPATRGTVESFPDVTCNEKGKPVRENPGSSVSDDSDKRHAQPNESAQQFLVACPVQLSDLRCGVGYCQDLL